MCSKRPFSLIDAADVQRLIHKRSLIKTLAGILTLNLAVLYRRGTLIASRLALVACVRPISEMLWRSTYPRPLNVFERLDNSWLSEASTVWHLDAADH
jgi:hypothetical protein